MAIYRGYISGTGNSETRQNEITADDVATVRNYIFGFDSGVIGGGTLRINVNEVANVRFTVDNDGHLIITEPADYQGTVFTRSGDNLIATTDPNLFNIEIQRIDNKLIAKGEMYE